MPKPASRRKCRCRVGLRAPCPLGGANRHGEDFRLTGNHPGQDEPCQAAANGGSMGNDVGLTQQFDEFAIAPCTLERACVQCGQRPGVCDAGFREHDSAACKQTPCDASHLRGRCAASCGCASGARKYNGFGGPYPSAAAAPRRAIQLISGALRGSTRSGGSVSFGHAFASRLAPEPMTSEGPVIAARKASRNVAMRGATRVRPPVPKI